MTYQPVFESAAQAFVDATAKPPNRQTATAKLLDLIDLAHRRGTGSYKKFASGYFLTTAAMRWFWDHHATDSAQRAEITASPLMATFEQLAGLPPAILAGHDHPSSGPPRRLTRSDRFE
jgi:hypothetical protein